MFKKILILIAVLSLMVFNCSKKTITNNYYPSPDKGSIVGFVYPPEPEVVVIAYLGTEVARTLIDTTGYFRFAELSPGYYTLVAHAEGYFDYTTKGCIPVTGGATVSVDTLFLISIHNLIQSVWPSDGMEEVIVDEAIRIDFRKGMNKSSVEMAFHIVPSVEGEFFWYEWGRKGIEGSSGLRFKPRDQFATNTLYQVTIDTTASDIEGISLSKPFRFSFTTEPIRILDTSPENGETWVDVKTSVWVTFNINMDLESVVLAFKMVDSNFKDVPGKFFPWLLRSIHFVPDTTLAPIETYTVTIDTNAKGISGGHLDKPYNFWFKTRPY